MPPASKGIAMQKRTEVGETQVALNSISKTIRWDINRISVQPVIPPIKTEEIKALLFN
jgi:hypothetical protein